MLGEDMSILEAHPADVVLDGVDVLDVLLGGVGVVKAQIALSAELLRDGKVNVQGLDVADVQIAVRFGRESGLHLPDHLSVGNVLRDKFLDEVRGGFLVRFQCTPSLKKNFSA